MEMGNPYLRDPRSGYKISLMYPYKPASAEPEMEMGDPSLRDLESKAGARHLPCDHAPIQATFHIDRHAAGH